MHRVCLFALANALVVTPALAEAQRRPAPRTTRVIVDDDDTWRRRDDVSARTMTLSVGVFNYDFADDDNFPMAALRSDWRLRNWLRSELSFAYAYADIDEDDALPEADEDNSHLLAATVGLNAELPWPVVRPYAGLAVGLFSRIDDGENGDFVRPTIAAPVGIRIPFSQRVALRGEVRWRWDQHPGGDSAVNREITAGLSFGY